MFQHNDLNKSWTPLKQFLQITLKEDNENE